MAYISARYMPADPIAPPGASRNIQAVDTEGLIWSFTEDSQVGDWLRYLEEGGTIEPELLEPKSEPEPEPPPPLSREEYPSIADNPEQPIVPSI
jgi:hypothetical protein